MASTADRVASILSDKKNTRFALAASLVATTDELQALREQLSKLRAWADDAERRHQAAVAQLEDTQLREAEMANALERAAGLPRCTWVNTTHAEFMGMTREATQPTMPAPKTEWPSAPRKLPAHFVAAREAAMRLGRAVKVTA